MKYVIVICFFIVLLLTGNASCSTYQPWSENFFQHVEQEYGANATKRLHYLQEFILKNQDLPAMEKLELVNTTLNRLPGIADSQHWKNADYWATPLETITTFGGDCEDIAIVKWFVLNHLGIPNVHLRLAYVKLKETSVDHMVLLYLESPDAPLDQQQVYVLDNIDQQVKESSERTDLLGVHVIDANGNVVLIADNGIDRSVKDVLKERKIKQLDDLKKKIAEERKKYQKINDDRPFWPPNMEIP